MSTISRYRNIKSGVVYEVLATDVRNATNAQHGDSMVLYYDPETEKLFTREAFEFSQKFEHISGDDILGEIEIKSGPRTRIIVDVPAIYMESRYHVLVLAKIKDALSGRVRLNEG